MNACHSNIKLYIFFAASSILSEEELKVREDVVLELEGKFKEIFKDAKLTLFGSSRNGFYMKGSDLDICLTFSSNEAGEVCTLNLLYNLIA